MKKFLLLMLSCQAVTGTFCQVLMNLQLPESGLTVKSQLWDMSLVNTFTQGHNVQIQLVMTDASGNHEVLSASSKVFFLPKGVRQIRASDVVPLTYTVADPSASVDNNPNGFLPAGAYRFCYRVINLDGEVPTQVGQECRDGEVEPLVPPMLISPVDSEQVEMPRPVFTWAPPMPGNLFGRLFYDWELVEVQGPQTGPEAIQQNVPVLYRSNIQGTSFAYPLSAPALDSTKIYAWRVVAKNNSAPVATSEVWNFTLRRTPADVVVPNGAGFARLSLENNDAFIICHGQLGYAFLNEKNVNSAAIAVYDITGGTHRPVSLDIDTCALRFGNNLNRLDLRATTGMTNGHFYQFELTDADNRRWYLKFQYKNN
ncbi:MAG TPA: hypothetical protein VHD83_24035 [Puia sp.]|nr:hypothetical protein [Puia sp.]